MNESERSEAISVLQDKLSWANQNRYPYVSQREVKAYQIAIKALEQEPILDKIRAEIEQIELLARYTRGDIKQMALDIIDKYREEQEDNGFFEIMDDESDGEVYEKIKEIIDKAKEQEE